MATPVSITIDEQTKSIYVLFDDGSVDTIRTVYEPHDPQPEWREVAPANPKAVVEQVVGWDAEDDEKSEAGSGVSE